MSALLVLVLTVTAWATSIDEVDNPRSHGGWVTDGAGVLDDAAEDRMDARIEKLHADLGVEIAVVTVQDVDGTPKDFATGLFNEWGIGDQQANNGLLVLLVLGQRRLEMETGYGLEAVLTDGWLGSMQQRVMVQRFKGGDFGGGLEAGLAEVDHRLRTDPEEAAEGTRGAIDVGQPAGSSTGSAGAYVMAGGAGVAGVMTLGGALWYRRRQRTCPDCAVYMPKLDEQADDEHLDEGQQVEERLGSVDYQVHVCPQCDRTRTFSVVKWFSGYDRCPKCSLRARSTQTTTLQAATQYSGGRVRITEDCRSCGYHRQYTRSTPRLPPPSSSSSGGGSSSSSSGSFGGGSSGGGGAGSSW